MAFHMTFDHDPDPGIALVMSTDTNVTDDEMRDLAQRILASDFVQNFNDPWTGPPAVSSIFVDEFRVVPLS